MTAPSWRTPPGGALGIVNTGAAASPLPYRSAFRCSTKLYSSLSPYASRTSANSLITSCCILAIQVAWIVPAQAARVRRKAFSIILYVWLGFDRSERETQGVQRGGHTAAALGQDLCSAARCAVPHPTTPAGSRRPSPLLPRPSGLERACRWVSQSRAAQRTCIHTHRFRQAWSERGEGRRALLRPGRA